MSSSKGFTVILVVLVVATAAAVRAAATSSFLWDAIDSSSYDYSVSVIPDSGGYRAYWCATEGGGESEGAYTQFGSAPWNFFSPTPALRTTGVRIVRSQSGSEYSDFRDQGGVYPGATTLGYLRRTAHAGSGATIPLTECQVGSDRFITGSPGAECGGLPQTFLGYAYGSGGPGFELRYRCYNPSTGDHLTSSNSACESKAGYYAEGPVGYWRVGTTWVSGTDVSAFPDGAFLCPNNVIKDPDGTYYMAYTASPYYGFGGPFNQLFLATSSNGVDFTPVVDGATGLPRPMGTYAASYVADVTARNLATERGNAFGVGLGTLIREGAGAYRIFYTDSSRFTSSAAPACAGSVYNPSPGGTLWRTVTRTASSPMAFLNNPADTGSCVLPTDAAGNEVDPNVTANPIGPKVTYDAYYNRYWSIQGNLARTTVRWSASQIGSATRFFASGSDSGTVGLPSATHVTPGGLFTDPFGVVNGYYGWYVYVGYTPYACDPGTDNSCGHTKQGVSTFSPY